MVILPHRWSFWHPYRQKWGKEATDLSSVSPAFQMGAKLHGFKQLFFTINFNSTYGQKQSVAGVGSDQREVSGAPASQEWFPLPAPHPSLCSKYLGSISSVRGIISQAGALHLDPVAA